METNQKKKQIVSFDSALHDGAIVVLDVPSKEPEFFDSWSIYDSDKARYYLAKLARKVAMLFPEAHFINEAPYVGSFAKKITSERQLDRILSDIRTKGYGFMRMSPGTAVIPISKAIGTFEAYYPNHYEMTAPEWRKLVGMPKKMKRKDAKKLAIDRALSLLSESAIRCRIAGGNDHLAEAYLMALALTTIIGEK